MTEPAIQRPPIRTQAMEYSSVRFISHINY
jgi:hypothetical protein